MHRYPHETRIGRREFLGAMAGMFAAELPAAQDRPNVLLIMSDQYFHGAMSIAGHPVVKTPNLDRLASTGVRFAHAVCPTPFCSPSRATILTGLFPHTHGITYNVRDTERGLDPKLFSTEMALSGAGYACAQRGKWHLGDKARIPGYEHDPDPDYNEYLRTAVAGPGGTGRQRRRGGFPVTVAEVVRKALEKADSSIAVGKSGLPIEHTMETWLAGLAIQKLEAMAARPFFLTVSFPAPHAPWLINDPYYSMYDRARIPLPGNRNSVEPVDRDNEARRVGQALGDEGLREYLGVYYGMCSMVDWNVGRLLDALRRLNLERNTLVIFIADHGDMQAGHGMYGKLNFSIYEETTRIPLLMRLPGRIPAGKVIQTQAGSCDIQPTILDYLGMQSPASIHGRSLRPYIAGKEDLERPAFIERERGKDNFQRVIRTINWKYCYCSSGQSQLYNLEKDPGETSNLLAESSAAAVRRKLHGELRSWMQQTGDRRAAQMPAGA
jgi:arylsulfatase A-like enzyme